MRIHFNTLIRSIAETSNVSQKLAFCLSMQLKAYKGWLRAAFCIGLITGSSVDIHALQNRIDLRIYGAGFEDASVMRKYERLNLPLDARDEGPELLSTIDYYWTDFIRTSASAISRYNFGDIGVSATVSQKSDAYIPFGNFHTVASAQAGWIEQLEVLGVSTETEVTAHLSLDGILTPTPGMPLLAAWTHLGVMIFDVPTETLLYRYDINHKTAESLYVNRSIDATFTVPVGDSYIGFMLVASTSMSGLVEGDFAMGVDALHSLKIDVDEPFTVPEGYTIERLSIPTQVPDGGATLPLLAIGILAVFCGHHVTRYH